MAEPAREHMFEEDYESSLGDPGVLLSLRATAAELASRNSPLKERPAASGYNLGRAEQLVVNFNRHPVRDVSLSALALTGLGFAAGAALKHRRHHH